MITDISAIVRSLLSFASLESSNCSGFRYSLIVISDVAWIITWTAVETNIRFSYASVPPLLDGTLWWQWMSCTSIGSPVTAHLPYWAANSDILLSAYSIDLPLTGLRISHNIASVLIVRFLWISSRPLTVYLLMFFLLFWAFFCGTAPTGTMGRSCRNLKGLYQS